MEMNISDRLRKQTICQFSGMTVDMDYLLCIPSVHAKYQDDDIVVDFCGEIRSISDSFPREKARLLIQWVSLHKAEIMINHHKIGHNIEPLIMIEPLDTSILSNH